MSFLIDKVMEKIFCLRQVSGLSFLYRRCSDFRRMCTQQMGLQKVSLLSGFVAVN